MKIYEIGTGYTPIPATMGAATEIVVEELTKAFLKLGEDVEIIDIAATDRAPHNLPISEVKVPKCFAGTDVKLGLMHKLKRVVYSICLAGELKKILRSGNEKVLLHFHNQYNLFFFLKLTPRKLREKAVIAYTNHSGIWRQDWEKIKDTITKRYFQEAECMKKADIVFVLNKETMYNAITYLGVAADRIRIITNGVNTDIYHPMTETEKLEAKKNWGLQGCRVILQVGSIYENKGQLRSLEGLMTLLQSDDRLVFAYAGGIVDEMYQKSILQFAKENHIEEQVRYMGMVEPGRELNRIYNTADMTILPSQYEGFSLVTIESCAAGIPVLAQRHGPVQFGEGCIFYDREHLADTLKQLLYCEAYDLSAIKGAARKNAVCNYSWDKIANEYKAIFLSA